MDFLTSIVAKHQKVEGGIFFQEKSHNAEKTERGDHLGIFNNLSVAKLKKIEEGPFEEIFFEKTVSQCRKN